MSQKDDDANPVMLDYVYDQVEVTVCGSLARPCYFLVLRTVTDDGRPLNLCFVGGITVFLG